MPGHNAIVSFTRLLIACLLIVITPIGPFYETMEELLAIVKVEGDAQITCANLLTIPTHSTSLRE